MSIPTIQVVRPDKEWSEIRRFDKDFLITKVDEVAGNHRFKPVIFKVKRKIDYKANGSTDKLRIEKRGRVRAEKITHRVSESSSKDVWFNVTLYNGVGIIEKLNVLFDLDTGFYNEPRRFCCKTTKKKDIYAELSKFKIKLVSEFTEWGKMLYRENLASWAERKDKPLTDKELKALTIEKEVLVFEIAELINCKVEETEFSL